MKSLLQTLIDRDGYTEAEAKGLIDEARQELQDRICGISSEDPHEICSDFFGLEPDYIMELL